MPLSVIFMGTPDFAVPTLQALLDSPHRVVAVYSQPPRPAGRGQKLTPSPVHLLAEQHGIPVHTPTSLKSSEEQAKFEAIGADVAVVAAYGLILPQAILDGCRYGCLNVHPSKLPRWRGASPIQRAIMAGDTETAMAIMRMDAGLDTGDICLIEDVPIPPDADTGQMHDLLAKLGGKMMIEALNRLEAGKLPRIPQAADGVTYAEKLYAHDLPIFWHHRAQEIVNQVRALSPLPGARFKLNGESWKLLKARAIERSHGKPSGIVLEGGDELIVSCGEDTALAMEIVQRPGRKPMPMAEVLRGFSIPVGTLLT